MIARVAVGAAIAAAGYVAYHAKLCRTCREGRYSYVCR